MARTVEFGKHEDIRALLIEDSDSDADLITSALSMLSRPRVTVQWARRLSEGIEYLNAGGVDVILLDLSLPDSHSIETITRTHKHASNTPIIILTGLDDKELALEALERGAQDYLVKGKVDSEVLLQAIQYAIQRRRIGAAEASVIKHEALLSDQIVEQSSACIAKLDTNLVIKSANESFIRRFLHNESLFPEKHIMEVIPALPVETIRQVVESRNSIRISELAVSGDKRRLTPDEEFFDISIWPMTNHEEEISGVVVLMEDVTERVQLQDQRDEFVATLAHDMKVPLIGTERVLQAVSEGKLGDLPPDMVDIVGLLRRSNQHLLWMVHNLLFVYREQQGVERIAPSQTELLPIIEDCIQEISPFISDPTVHIEVDIEPNLPDVLVDRIALRRVLLNLLHNACKHTSARDSIKIKACRHGSELELSVMDSGTGIPADILPTLFSRFWTPPPTKKVLTTTTGLGLFVCKKIVEAHGGTISCTSTVNEGTTFTIKLPEAIPKSNA